MKQSTLKNRPKILQRLQEEVRQYYRSPSRLPSLNAANRSKRQQRSERREACILLLNAILEFTDLTSLRCGVPTSTGFQSLTLAFLARYTGMGERRMERAIADLKFANILTVAQPRQLQEDGSYRGLAAVKAVNSLLFGAFGLLKWLKHERERASERLAKKARAHGGNLGEWSRSAMAIGRMLVVGRQTRDGLPRIGSTQKPPARRVDAETYGRMFNELVGALKEEDPSRDAAECRRIAEAILKKKLAG
ncbi:hypothetical protein [Metapseudomonas otitidis]|uniref:hypothetical protein n=1 Tax=Metapseudomonas otitidis TaxID=319939 RepID=UPI0013DFA398|nr:hypothetical protein [Pseudomonas otitidis]